MSAAKEKDEYKQALFKAATKAANIVANHLEPSNTGSTAIQLSQLKTSLQLLAIVEGLSQPDQAN
jgi:hypothetical protein